MLTATVATATHRTLYAIIGFGGLGSGILTALIFWKLHDNHNVVGSAESHFWNTTPINLFYLPSTLAWFSFLYIIMRATMCRRWPALWLNSIAADCFFLALISGLGGAAVSFPLKYVRKGMWYRDHSIFSGMADAVLIASCIIMGLAFLTLIFEITYVLVVHDMSADTWTSNIRTLSHVHRHSTFFPPENEEKWEKWAKEYYAEAEASHGHDQGTTRSSVACRSGACRSSVAYLSGMASPPPLHDQVAVVTIPARDSLPSHASGSNRRNTDSLDSRYSVEQDKSALSDISDTSYQSEHVVPALSKDGFKDVAPKVHLRG